MINGVRMTNEGQEHLERAEKVARGEDVEGVETNVDNDGTDSENEGEEEVEPEFDLEASTPDEQLSPSELEEQEWPFGEKKDSEIIEYKGFQMLVSEPDEEAIMNAIQGAEGANNLDQMYLWVDLVVDKPKITKRQWKEEMSNIEKLGLGTVVMEWVGMGDFMPE